MLHRSFKPAKCKTSLKLATSRLKLLKNKKDIQLKQMKRELAQLLESGQDQTARIRVEHVVREEKMMAAFDLLEIYCELIVARLPIIESQKNCPIDMKEAVTSVVFAAPRCADVPELHDICKHLTAKYGKEFISAATELRPQCGVSRMLVEKLSANAPDGPTKIKILTAIAEEHNIKWDPKSFGETELKHREDLLNGPSPFEKVSRMQTEASIVQPPSYVQSPPTPERKRNEPVNFEHNVRHSENFPSEDARGSQAGMPTRRHPGVRPSGVGSERHSYSEDENSFPSDRKHWNVEFKNATAAAQAAAEAAERASMAARAAAELSSREQYATESRKSNVPSSRDEGPSKNDHDNQEEDIDKLMNDFLKGARYTGNSSFEEESAKAERSAGVSGNNVRKEPGRSDGKFVGSGHGSMQTDSLNYFPEESIRKQNSSVSSHMHSTGDLYSQKSSEEASPGINLKRQSTGSGAEILSSGQGGMESQSFNYFAEESMRETNGSVSPHLYSSSRGDGYDISPFTQPKYEFDGGRGNFDRENEHRDAEQTSSYSNTAAVFDEPVSDDDHVNVFDTTHYAVPAFDPYPASPVRESPRHPPSYGDTWSPRQNTSAAFGKYPSVSNVFQEAHSPSKFDESSIKSAKLDELSSLAFDESEGPSSESEDEVDNSRLGQKTEPISLSQKENGDSVSNRKEDLNDTSDDEWVHVNKQRTEFGEQAREKSIRQSSAKLAESQVISNDTMSEPFDSRTEERKIRPAQTSRLSSGNEVEASNTTFSPRQSNNMKDDELLRQSSLESGNKLKFGMLTGGLRQKSYMPPPYTKSPSSNASSFEKAAEDSVTSIENSPAFPSVKSSVKSAVSSSNPMADSDSDSDESEEIPQRKLSSKTEPYSPQSSKELESKPRLRAPVRYFDSEDNDAEDDIPKQTVNRAGRVGTGFSRRTKATPSSGRSSQSMAKFGSEASEPNSEAIASRSSNYSETGNSIQQESPPQSRAEKESTSRPNTESRNSRSSYLSESPSYPSYQSDHSSNLGRSPPEPRAARQSPTKPMPESNVPTWKEKPNSSVFDPPSSRQGNVQSPTNQATSKPRPESSPLRTVKSAGIESPGSSTSSGELPSGDSSQKKASHVHPKLPDYDSFAAHFQSLRSNR